VDVIGAVCFYHHLMQTWVKRISLLAAVAVGTAILSGCIGFDPGMSARCVMTWQQDHANSYADQTNCPGDKQTILNSGNYWQLGSNAPKPNGSHCGLPGLAYKINASNSPLQFGMTWGDNGVGRNSYTADMAISRNACADDTEITFAMFNGKWVAAPGLKTSNDIRIVSRAGINHVNVAAYVRDQNGQKWTLAMVMRPTSGADPRWNPNPPAGTFFRGSSEMAGSHLILLDASYFGAPRLCTDGNCPWTRVGIDWDRAFQYVRDKGWWKDLWPVWNTARASVALQIQTFDNGSKIRVQHRLWVMDGNA
jgi:hypothetical protein